MVSLKFSGLRQRLLLLILLAVLPAFGLIVYSAIERRQAAVAVVERNALGVARLAAAQQREIVAHARQLLVSLAKIPDVRGAGPSDACNRTLASLLHLYPNFSDMGVLGPNGDLVCSAIPPNKPLSAASHSFFTRAVKTRDFAIGDYEVSPVTGKNVLPLAYPYVDESERLRAVVFASIDLSWLQRILSDTQLPQGSLVTLVDSQGIILARYPESGEFVGKAVPDFEAFKSIAAGGGEGVTNAAGLDGVARVYAFVPLYNDEASAKAYVRVATPKAAAYATADRELLRNLLLMGAVTLLGFVAAWFGSDLFVLRRVKTLTTAARRLGQGDLGARSGLSPGHDEFGQLAGTFDDMARNLEQQQDELHRVNRALKVLSAGNRTLLRAQQEQELLNAMCRAAVEAGGYRMAWVGYKERDEQKSIRPVTHFGFEEGYLQTLDLSWIDTERGRGPAGVAIRTGQPCVAQDLLTDPSFAPWREAATLRGYGSAVALPLRVNQEVIGVLTLYAEEPNAFGALEVELLSETADDLAYGIAALRMRLKHELAERELHESEERFRLITENARDLICMIDPEGRHAYVSPSYTAVLGYNTESLLNMRAEDLVNPEDRNAVGDRQHDQMYEVRVRKANGEWAWIEGSSYVVTWKGRPYVVGIARDVTQRKTHEARIAYLATHDALTDLPNRNLLADRIAQTMAHAWRSGRTLAVAVLALDRVKFITDSFGHALGDTLLKAVAVRLQGLVREGDTVASLGRDEFAILLTDLRKSDDVVSVVQKLIGAFADPLRIQGQDLYVTASVGISIYPADGDGADMLLKNADAAMYRVKEQGGNSFQFYTQEMSVQAQEHVQLENALRRALERWEFELHYQPQLDLKSGRISGVEALIRWRHPELGMVSPGRFIPLAEETGLIVPIGEWVLKTACIQAKAWQAAGNPELSVAVNVSARQFRQQNIPQLVRGVLDDTGLDAAYLELELTESILMQETQALNQTMRELKAMGVMLSLDDFGTGYSSLSYLKRFPIDTVKIDQSFINDVTTSANNASITKTIISMARSLNMKIVAEGVETEGQLGFLSANRCDAIQGYYFSRPLPADELTSLLRDGKPMPVGTSGREDSRTLLLVDDEENILSALKRVLRRDGYRILSTSSAREGLELLATHSVGVIVSDQRMPEMTGVEFLRRVKELHPDTVRIVLSGYTELQSVTDAINEGAIYKFLTKPWEDDLLRANIAEAFLRYELAAENKRLTREIKASNAELSRVNAELQELIEEKSRRAERGETSLSVAQEALQHMPLPVLGVDEAGMIVVANGKAEKALGTDIPLLGSDAVEVLPAALAVCLSSAGDVMHRDVMLGERRFDVASRPLGAASRSRGTLLVLVPQGALE